MNLTDKEYRILLAQLSASIVPGITRMYEYDEWGKHTNKDVAGWAVEIAEHIMDITEITNGEAFG